jgi:hypothetical protein
MVAAVQIFTLILFLLALVSLILGLVKPVLVLWFLDRFNRLKVLKIYGAATVIFFTIWFFMKLLSES